MRLACKKLLSIAIADVSGGEKTEDETGEALSFTMSSLTSSEISSGW